MVTLGAWAKFLWTALETSFEWVIEVSSFSTASQIFLWLFCRCVRYVFALDYPPEPSESFLHANAMLPARILSKSHYFNFTSTRVSILSIFFMWSRVLNKVSLSFVSFWVTWWEQFETRFPEFLHSFFSGWHRDPNEWQRIRFRCHRWHNLSSGKLWRYVTSNQQYGRSARSLYVLSSLLLGLKASLVNAQYHVFWHLWQA